MKQRRPATITSGIEAMNPPILPAVQNKHDQTWINLHEMFSMNELYIRVVLWLMPPQKGIGSV